MTIEKGKEWGHLVPHPRGGEPVVGDLARELGVESISTKQRNVVTWRELPLDLLDVTCVLEDGAQTRFTTPTHVTCGRPWGGEYCVVSSTSFVEGRRVFDRAHPNDGRLDWLRFTQNMSLRQRLEFRRRTRIGTHLPHPEVHTGTGTFFEAKFRRPVTLHAAHTRIRRVLGLSVTVLPDGSLAHIPAGDGEVGQPDVL